MEDAASDASVHRSRRARVTRSNIGGDGTCADVREPDEQNPNQPDNDDSMDDFDEILPKVNRSRAAEHSTAQFGDQRLIEFVRSTKNGKKHTLAKLLTVSLEVCGVKYQIGIDFEELDVHKVMANLVDLARKGDGGYFQSSMRKEFKNLKDKLIYFWQSLAFACQNGPLFDQVVFEKCMDYVIALSCTPPRFYRQVATTIGLQLLTSCTTKAKMLSSQQETTQKQLNAVREKFGNHHPSVVSLNKRFHETCGKKTSLEKLMSKIFQGFFGKLVCRFRDVDPNIRMSCIQSLGQWMLQYPSMFLQNRNLKYLYGALSDKNADVRKASVIALQSLSETDDNVSSPTSLITKRFANRMIELADDVNISVAVSAIRLLMQLLRHQLLSDDDLDPLYKLLIDKPPEIRRAIGELVYDHLIAQGSASNASSKGTDEDTSLVTLSRMLQILGKFSTDPILISHVIDVVWEFMKSMKDWKCIIAILVAETPSIELSEYDVTNLLRLLSASIRKAVGERIAPAVDNRKPKITDAKKKKFDKTRHDMTSALMEDYPSLLRKYMADKARVPSLMEIIQNMKLELYSSTRKEQNFKFFFKHLKTAFFSCWDKESLRSCVQAINFCITESKGDLQDFVRNELNSLEDDLQKRLKKETKNVLEGYSESTLLANLKRLYELQLSKYVPIDSLLSDISDISKMVKDFRSRNEEVVIFLLLNMYLHLSWSLHFFVNNDAASTSLLSSLCSQRDTLLKHLQDLLYPSYDEGDSTVRNYLAGRVCLILADMWCLFRKANFSSTPMLEILGFSPDQSAIEQFWRLCEQQLNISNENDEEDVSKEEYFELINPDSVLIAAGKLITTVTVPTGYLGCEVISRFTMHGNSAAEIVDHLISVLRSRADITDLFIAALKTAYRRHQIKVTSIDEESTKRTLQDCNDLSLRLCGTLMGSDILKIVKNGIEYAFTDIPNHLSFLECIVLHFASKLPTTDVSDILKDVQGRTEKLNTDEDPSGWSPYHKFVVALQGM